MNSNRREFVKVGLTTSGGLYFAVNLLGCTSRAAKDQEMVANEKRKAGRYVSLYLEVTPESDFLPTFDKTEMGQGVITGQATMFGEEADIDPKKFVMRPVKALEAYGTVMGLQVTGGSTSTSDRYEVLRMAGASYRRHVLLAAAKEWQVPVGELSTDNGVVRHQKSGRETAYGSLNRTMAGLATPDPEKVALKRPSDFRYIGKKRGTVDAKEKVTGAPEYGIDFELPGMKTAVVLRSPVFGGKVKSFDQTALKNIAGVKDVIQIPSGIALVCDKYYHCLTARQAVTDKMIVWDIAKEDRIDSKSQRQKYRESLDQTPPKPGSGETVVSSRYALPFLAHAPLEPQNTTAWKQKDKLEVWSPSQIPTIVKRYGAIQSGLNRDQVHVYVSKYLGGGFGRRGSADFAAEAIDIALQVDYPVKVMWTREDDMQHSPMRPMTVHRLDAVVGKKISSWRHQIAGESILQELVEMGMPMLTPEWVPNFVGSGLGSTASGLMDVLGQVPMMAEGTKQAYDFEVDADMVEHETKVPVLFWRSVGHSHNGFVVESFLDEVLHAMGKDPLAGRLELLHKAPKAKAVVEKVAEMADWQGQKPSSNRALGLSYHFSFNTYCAEIADVEVKGEQIIVHNVWAAVDCGQVINPDIVEAQVRSGIIFGLTAALHSEVEFRNGEVLQKNFDSYPLLRLNETPNIEVAMMASTKKPTGIGEPGLPPIAGAVGNAIFRATGQRLRRLPMRIGSTTA